MTKITGAGKAGAARPSKAAGKATKTAAGGFRVGASSAVSAHAAAAGAESTAAASLAPTETMSALIALQTEGGGKAKTVVAAQRALALLDRIRDGLLAGRIQIRDLEALASAAEAKSKTVDTEDAALTSLYNDITLRARVELAKLGR